jgi:hypothetical protein
MSESENARPSRARRVSVFALAKIDFSIRAEIGVGDVQSLRPAWTETQCMEFLRQYGDTIGREMAMSGAVALAALLEGGRHAN